MTDQLNPTSVDDDAGPVGYRLDDGIAVIELRRPPVNALSFDLRAGLASGLSRAHDDDAVAVVLIGSPRFFSAGADISEFGDQATRPPLLAELTALIENMERPVVAAVEGLALGGGFELALASHQRVASPRAEFGLPEISLGLIPGSGGTQRLPRLVGAELALSFIASGDRVSAERALELGIVDAVIDGNFVEGAISWARENAAVTPTREREDRLLSTRADRSRFDEMQREIMRSSVNKKATAACIAAVEASFDAPFAEGLTTERAHFIELVSSDESAAQRYAFFTDRVARRAMGQDIARRPEIERAAVIGAGTMGSGIAQSLLSAGIEVTLCDVDADARERAANRINADLERSVTRGRLQKSEADEQWSRLGFASSFDAVATAELTIEAIVEDMDAKTSLFGEIARHAPARAILATNTSYLDVRKIAAASGRPQDVLGLHFFSPANIMPLVELVRTEEVDPAAVASAIDLVLRLGKTPVVVGVCHGFVGNRMLARRSAQADKLLLEGALPDQVDRVVREFGFRMGPFEVSDLSGLDISWRNRQQLGLSAPVADTLVEQGWLGQKASRGFYRYDGRERVVDHEVEQTIAAVSAAYGVARRSISDDEILDRLILPMVDEAAQIVDEGIVTRASDIDVVWRGGYGWPVVRGGPVWYARRRGLDDVRARLVELAERAGDESLRPSPAFGALSADDPSGASGK